LVLNQLKRKNKPRNTAESTGRFPILTPSILYLGYEGLSVPPTPTPITARSDANVIKLGEPPAARPKTPARNRVTLKHHLTKTQKRFILDSQVNISATHRLPQTSQPKPQNIAPTSKPALAAKLRNGALKVNSSVTGARMRPVINYFLVGGK